METIERVANEKVHIMAMNPGMDGGPGDSICSTAHINKMAISSKDTVEVHIPNKIAALGSISLLKQSDIAYQFVDNHVSCLNIIRDLVEEKAEKVYFAKVLHCLAEWYDSVQKHKQFRRTSKVFSFLDNIDLTFFSFANIAFESMQKTAEEWDAHLHKTAGKAIDYQMRVRPNKEVIVTKLMDVIHNIQKSNKRDQDFDPVHNRSHRKVMRMLYPILVKEGVEDVMSDSDDDE
jgi:hypothetical protein